MKRAEIARLLPEIYQRTIRPGSPLAAILDVMETLHAPAEEVLGDLDRFFDPYRAPDHFVPFLAFWVDLDQLLATGALSYNRPDYNRPEDLVTLLPSGLGRLRELIAAAAYLSQWRGTAAGLLRFVETATGIQGYAIEEQVPGQDGVPGGVPRPFHIRLRAPRAAEPYRVMLERIIELEKPAYVTYDLIFQEAT